MIKNHHHLSNINFNYKKTLQALLKNKTKIIDMSYSDVSSEVFKCQLLKSFDEARDLSHPGEKTSINTANYIYNQL